RRWTTPIRASNYELKVPEGAADLIQVRLTAAEPTELAPLNWHMVRKGETIATIARKLKVSRADLAEANYLSLKSRVASGQKLVIPRAPNLLLAARTDAPAPVAESRRIESTVALGAVAPAAEAPTPAKVVHRVRRGDTLASIARLYRTTVASLKTWNRITGNAIRVGDRLTIYRNRANAD